MDGPELRVVTSADGRTVRIEPVLSDGARRVSRIGPAFVFVLGVPCVIGGIGLLTVGDWASLVFLVGGSGLVWVALATAFRAAKVVVTDMQLVSRPVLWPTRRCRRSEIVRIDVAARLGRSRSSTLKRFPYALLVGGKRFWLEPLAVGWADRPPLPQQLEALASVRAALGVGGKDEIPGFVGLPT
jgi:hypothetical protein